MKITAMIPMRLGSTRIPKKNIRYLLDKPLMQYSIDLATKCSLFDEVWVNSECEKLRPYVESLDACFHKRPDELAADKATNRDFTYEFLQKHQCDYLVMINTTSPLLRTETLCSFLKLAQSDKFDTVLSVVSEQAETFYRGIPLNFSLDRKINSQLLEPTEKIVWAITAWRRETFLRLQEQGENPIFGGKLGRFPIPKDEACDLDVPEDWRIAEATLLSRKSQFEERYLQL